MNEHEKWLSRRVYHETFSTPGAEFPSWRGIPNRCNCGCSEVWYDRLSPTNWWATFNPAGYISIVWGVVRVFLALHRVLWHISSRERLSSRGATATVVVWATVWVLSRPGVILLIALCFLTLVLATAVLSIALIIAVIAISMSGLVFIIGGLGSILYLDNPVFGITAIVIGVCVQYELHRREGRRREEQLGYLIRMLRPPAPAGKSPLS